MSANIKTYTIPKDKYSDVFYSKDKDVLAELKAFIYENKQLSDLDNEYSKDNETNLIQTRSSSAIALHLCLLSSRLPLFILISMKLKITLYIYVIFIILFVRPSYAYIDPGTGSYLIQIMIASLIGAPILLSSHIKRVRNLLKKKLKNNPEEQNDNLD